MQTEPHQYKAAAAELCLVNFPLNSCQKKLQTNAIKHPPPSLSSMNYKTHQTPFPLK